MLDAQAEEFTEEMALAAATAIADVVGEDKINPTVIVPERLRPARGPGGGGRRERRRPPGWCLRTPGLGRRLDRRIRPHRASRFIGRPGSARAQVQQAANPGRSEGRSVSNSALARS